MQRHVQPLNLRLSTQRRQVQRVVAREAAPAHSLKQPIEIPELSPY
jgi:hypothetical protein